MAIIIDNKYQIGDLVYLKTDSEQRQHIVTQINVLKDTLVYICQRGSLSSAHYDFELSTDKDVLKPLTNDD